jgi:hypothetical protein
VDDVPHLPAVIERDPVVLTELDQLKLHACIVERTADIRPGCG